MKITHDIAGALALEITWRDIWRLIMDGHICCDNDGDERTVRIDL